MFTNASSSGLSCVLGENGFVVDDCGDDDDEDLVALHIVRSGRS